MVLLLGRDDRDPLFLQAKEAGMSVLEAHLGPGEHDNHGERVVRGQRLMETVGDVFLGWQRSTGIDGRERDFYIRQLRTGRARSRSRSRSRSRRCNSRALVCTPSCAAGRWRAHTPAPATASQSPPIGASSAFDRMVRFADAYADLNEGDHRALQEAVTAGRVQTVDV
jgi:Uncharacterized protein conserved in bacteria (DUF2252)